MDGPHNLADACTNGNPFYTDMLLGKGQT